MASLEDRFVKEQQPQPDSDEEAAGELFADSGAATAERLRPVRDGGCMTGPKGVIKDRQRALEREAEERRKRLDRLEEYAKSQAVNFDQTSKDEEEEELSAEDKAFMAKYREQRIRELSRAAETAKYEKTFGTLIHLVHRTYTQNIDNEPESVFVVIHIYDSFQPECMEINRCLVKLAQQYPMVKFCKILGLATDLSETFLSKGLPALLIYRKGNLVGNFPAVSREIPSISTDLLADFLKKNSCIPDVEPQPDEDDF